MYPAPPVTRVVATASDCTVRRVIAAVVVTYSAAPRMLDACVAALRADGGVGPVVVVDTGGGAAPADPDVELLRVDNRGYGAAANAGIRRAFERGADAVAVLNDDVTVRPGWLAPLAAELSGDRVGAVQPKLLHADTGLINSLGVRIGSDGAGTDVGDGERDRPGGDPSDIEIFSGGAVLVSRAFVEDTGGFDERWFLYYEDVDLALRGGARGWTFRLAPGSIVEHARGLSTSADPRRTRYLQERNRLWLLARHRPWWQLGPGVALSLARLAKTTALTVTRVGLLVELLARQRLVDGGVPDLADLDVRADDVFAPTTAVDAWAHLATDRRWFGMAHAWLDLPRRPWQIGDTDRDGNTLAALSSELFDANAGTGRRAVLAPLLDAEPAHPVAIDTLVAALGWRHPRQLRRMTRHVVSETLREATELGLVAHGSLTTAGRAALTAPAVAVIAARPPARCAVTSPPSSTPTSPSTAYAVLPCRYSSWLSYSSHQDMARAASAASSSARGLASPASTAAQARILAVRIVSCMI